jgi:hypothetical protein
MREASESKRTEKSIIFHGDLWHCSLKQKKGRYPVKDSGQVYREEHKSAGKEWTRDPVNARERRAAHRQ